MARRTHRGPDANQLLIDWTPKPTPTPRAATAASELSIALPWDFQTTFPQPTDEAIDAGVIDPSDTTPQGLQSLHEEYGRVALAMLAERDRLTDVRRHGIDPATGKAPRTDAARSRLAKALAETPERQENAFDVLMLTYRDAFGDEAAEAFASALRARHVGVTVVVAQAKEHPTQPGAAVARHEAERGSTAQHTHRVSTSLPVPKPLAEAVAAGHFGYEEDGRPVKPGPAEVRAITEQHAAKLIDLLNQDASDRAAAEQGYTDGIAAYRESFGEEAARRLEAHVRHEDRRAASRGR